MIMTEQSPAPPKVWEKCPNCKGLGGFTIVDKGKKFIRECKNCKGEGGYRVEIRRG